MCVLTTHVDNLLWHPSKVDKLLTKLEVGRREHGRIRFYSKQFDKSGNDVDIDVTDTTNKITYLDVNAAGGTRIL